ncbi:nuclear speckle splicing regulatory protein 1 [Tachyglossus aculeatus]|uniref:nuclear speckle splicing regulatory protein 1 n=1 Tax=Tachyglossus aculeatus TaxID=9261 RepID=UPI0018F56E08|nr:nuclear speckle splicing regulatory protein 1 [Tachyglossus aculeatus]
MAAPARQYGLILPKKTQQLQPVLQRPSVFAEESDDETSVGESLQREAFKKQVMKQTKLEIQKALAEDSTVYEYDSIYDEMQQRKEEANAKVLSGKDRKPKYIHNLLKAVEIRKKEQEKRMEKKIQKEREMEKGEFDHKEAFVTSAYKKKLQERAEEEEREKREAALEARLDVTKQKDLSGFYRHLLNQTVGEEEVPDCSLREAGSRIKQEKPRGYADEMSPENRSSEERTIPKTHMKKDNPDADSDFDESSEDEEEKNGRVRCQRKGGADSSETLSRHQRSQTHSRSSSEEGGGPLKQSHTKSSRVKDRGTPERQRGDPSQERDCERRPKDREEKQDQPRHGEPHKKDSSRNRPEHEDKPRRKDRREMEGNNKEQREKVWEDRCSERDRPKNDRYRSIEDREKCKEKEDHWKERKDRHNKDDKCGDRDRSTSERDGGRRESSPRAGTKVRPGQESAPKEPGRGEEGGSNSGRLPGPKGRPAEEEQKDKGPKLVSKFAKRSSAETVMSARDRYLARQMARVSAKTYIEKEED